MIFYLLIILFVDFILWFIYCFIFYFIIIYIIYLIIESIILYYFKTRLKRNRKSAYRKKGLLFEAKGSTGPYELVIIEASSWPNISSMRVQMNPVSMLDYSNANQKSLWYFIASEARNGMSLDYNAEMAFRCIGMRFSACDQKVLFETFKMGVCCELWVRSTDSTNKIGTLIKPKFKKAVVLRFYAPSEAVLKERFAFCPVKKEYTRSHITPDDLFECSVKEVKFCDLPNCGKFFLYNCDYERHLLTCINNSPQPKVIYRQRRMSEYANGEELLLQLGLEHQIKHFVAYDIETLTAAPNDTKKRNQTLCSVSARKSWSNEIFCFTREDSNSSSGFQLVEKFLSYLEDCQKEYQGNYCDFGTIRSRLERFANRANIMKTYEVQAAFELLSDLERVRIIGFNSEHYDLPALYPYLSAYFGSKKIEFSCIRRGNGEFIFFRLMFYYLKDSWYFPRQLLALLTLQTLLVVCHW